MIGLISKEIGVGILVGLASAIFLGIYNYFKGKKERRIEKYYREQKAKENEIANRITTLEELRDKEILTTEEFNEKKKAVDFELLDKSLKNSDEYEQLKELYEKGLFSQKEFDAKLIILRDKIANYNSNKEQKTDFRKVSDYNDGFAVVVDDDLNYGFINENGDIVIDVKYEYADNFQNGLALVRSNALFGFINNNGKVIIPIEFDRAEGFNNDQAKVSKNEQEFYIDTNGKRIT